MQQRNLGVWGSVSVLTLGGGGTGQVYGATDRAEAVATVHEAVRSGINVLDLAPTYGAGEAERVVGEAFDGHLPEGVRITTKKFVDGEPAPEAVPGILERALEDSLSRLRLDRVDLFFLHGLLIPDDAHGPYKGTRLHLYREAVRPTMQRLKAQGRIGGWGITAVGFPSVLLQVFDDDVRPDAVQAVTNLLDTPGNMHVYPEDAQPRALIAAAHADGIGVMGIRALAAGALADQLDRTLAADRPEVADYVRAASFRTFAHEAGIAPSLLAYRYALSMPGVSTLILGVKNRIELREALQAEAEGPLAAEVIASIDAATGAAPAGADRR
jgi:aryl-alcohol dehydrogenase-like predicted oxidoreductase